MPQDFYSKLEIILKQDSRFVDQEGDLLKNNVIDAAYKADKKLVELLLSGKEFKNKFFSKVKDVLVFNINDFVAYIQDKNFLADSYTKYRNKIGLNIDGKFLNERKEVALVWPFKDCVLEGGMTKEDEKRKEIFFNEILAQDEIDKLLTPKVLTNWKKYSQKGEEKVKDLKRDDNGTIRENLIIKGNNLLALHSLKQQFQNKIKLIYIDPPYNTGNDSFGYNDNFNHSTWLTFMKNRLEAARKLLRDDGVIFISCDDNEQAYLKVLMDEVFNRENFIANLIKQSKVGGGSDTKHIVKEHEYIICYAKNIEQLPEMFTKHEEQYLNRYKEKDKNGRFFWDTFARPGLKNPITYIVKAPDGTMIKGDWIRSKKRFEDDLKNGEVRFIKLSSGKWSIQFKQRLNEAGKKPRSLAINIGGTIEGKKDIKELFGDDRIFLYPKSVAMIKFLLKIVDDRNAMILDFFVGSGTTAQAVLELNKEDGGNRKFILCEQMEYVEKITVERIKKVIKNLAKDKNLFSGKEEPDFVYCELMEYNELFVDKIKKAKDTPAFAKAMAGKNELLKIWEEMKVKSFLNYNIDIKKFDETIDEFKELPFAKQQRTLFDLLNKNQLYVNLSEIEDKEFKIGEEDKKMNMKFYG